ncbi:MAG: hypothetical protein IH600_07600 [Bacteroidetes bacterium]|nr:hypothetical protein [Bacteroidota bacterium]
MHANWALLVWKPPGRRAGSAGQGAYRYDGRSLSYLAFPLPHGVAASGSLGRIFAIGEDAAGNIWFGTRDNGAWRFNGASLTNFTMEDGLTSRMVWTIYRDKRNALWFGLGDGSVCRFNGKSFDRIY